MIPLSAHLYECCNTEPKFQMFPFVKMNSDRTSAILNKEYYFIKYFNKGHKKCHLKQRTKYGLENGNLGFIETLQKQ